LRICNCTSIVSPSFNPTNDPEQDEAIRRQLADTFGIRAGGNFSPLFTDRGLNQVQRLPFVQAAEYRLYQSNRPGTVILALLVTLQPPEAGEKPPQPPTGLPISGDIRDFPTLYQSDRSLVKFILNGAKSSNYSTFWSFIACYHFDYHWEHHEYPYLPWYSLPIARHKNEGVSKIESA
jgi:hypothetical protein